MEPVREEESGRLDEGDAPIPVRKSSITAPFTASRRTNTRGELPSLKYKNIDEPVLRRAQSPPRPTLPRRRRVRTWQATAKERNPLASCLTGPGRAGKFGELLGDTGGKYEGEVLAGRPHGTGQYFVPKDDGTGSYALQYDGDWVQGRKEGFGTRYYLNGEQYSGQFMANIRHGHGRYFFANGDMYAGEWVDDRRTGRGMYFSANGDIFVGSFIRDKKEGMGTLYMISRQKKYIAEYVSGQPKCGSVLDIDDEDLEPLKGQLAKLALQQKLDLAASGRLPPRLPALELLQPNKVLGPQFAGVRKARAESKSASMRAVQANSGTLSEKDLEMLRHSFTLMAAGDDPKVGLLPHQLRELCVMAGLDPAASATRLLVEWLLERKDPANGRISFDSFLKVALHFREKSSVDLAVEQEEDAAVADHFGLAAALEQETAEQEAAAAAEEELFPPGDGMLPGDEMGDDDEEEDGEYMEQGGGAVDAGEQAEGFGGYEEGGYDAGAGDGLEAAAEAASDAGVQAEAPIMQQQGSFGARPGSVQGPRPGSVQGARLGSRQSDRPGSVPMLPPAIEEKSAEELGGEEAGQAQGSARASPQLGGGEEGAAAEPIAAREPLEAAPAEHPAEAGGESVAATPESALPLDEQGINASQPAEQQPDEAAGALAVPAEVLMADGQGAPAEGAVEQAADTAAPAQLDSAEAGAPAAVAEAGQE